jgi:hypothetical protein
VPSPGGGCVRWADVTDLDGLRYRSPRPRQLALSLPFAAFILSPTDTVSVRCSRVENPRRSPEWVLSRVRTRHDVLDEFGGTT